MEARRQELTKIQQFVKEVDKEVTLILQSLQWNRKHLLECKPMVVCRHDSNHRIPLDKQKEHEDKCFLKSQDYLSEDILLPDPVEANTLVKLSSENIQDIIDKAYNIETTFNKGHRTKVSGSEPLSLERLHASYTQDERRVIHDAVVSAVPSCHDLSDLALPSDAAGSASGVGGKSKSRLEVLAELRDMKRRRTRYRVASRSAKYSHALRDVISAQMELYTETLMKSNTSQNGSSDKTKNMSPARVKTSVDKYDKGSSRHPVSDREREVSKERKYTTNEHKRKYDYDVEADYYQHRKKDRRAIYKDVMERDKEKNSKYYHHDNRRSDDRRDRSSYSSSSRDSNRYHDKKKRDDRSCEKYIKREKSPEQSRREYTEHRWYYDVDRDCQREREYSGRSHKHKKHKDRR